MGSRVRSLLFGTAAICLMVGALSPPALAAIDQTPPKLKVNIKPRFVVGSTVERFTSFPVEYAENIAQLIKWSATDNVGVCSYDLFLQPAGSEPEPILEFSQDTQYTYQAGDYNGDFGGGIFVTTGFYVTARDCQGNATTKVVSEQVTVNQEDGQSATGPSGTLSYSGTWGTASCSCFLWEHTRRTSQSGARVTFTRTYEKGDQVALVMALGPNRGRASIRIDGVFLANIDTFAAVNTNRVVVFQRMMPAGTHTVTIVNQATAGRPRIDLDAVMTN
jgi:hypothetical protein